MMTPSLVSTIIPVFNRSVLLQEAIFSVLEQTYRPIEIIIVDDGSTDYTGQVADSLQASYPGEIRVLHQTNCGSGSARETGRRLAKGEFIQYLDSDDLLLPRKFELQVNALKRHPECDIAYGKTRYYRHGEVPVNIAWKRTGERIITMFPSFLLSRWWGTSTPLYRRNILDIAGPWLALQNEEDWEYDCRIATQNVMLCYCDEFVSDERTHEYSRLSESGSSNPLKLKDRAIAHATILGHAQSAGIPTDIPEMQHFARELFLLSRQCGAVGLADESRRLFDLARQASGKQRAKGLDFRLYQWAAKLFGWIGIGKISCWLDQVRI